LHATPHLRSNRSQIDFTADADLQWLVPLAEEAHLPLPVVPKTFHVSVVSY